MLAIVAISAVLAAGLLVPAVWAQGPEITGIQWQWTELTDEDGQTQVANPENFLMALMEDGSAVLKADCNQVLWTYTLEGDSLTFNTMGPSTLAFCGEESLDQMYLAKLGMGGTVSMDGDSLVITLNDEEGTMVFANGGPVEEEAAAEEAPAEEEAAAPETVPETGGAPLAAPWVITFLTGMAALGAGAALKRR
jgi:heat shock protein HslJ